MRSLSGSDVDAALELLGYVCDFGDANGIVRISTNLVLGPKAIFFPPLDEDETIELLEFERFLKDEGIDPVAVNEVIGYLLG